MYDNRIFEFIRSEEKDHDAPLKFPQKRPKIRFILRGPFFQFD